MGVDRHLFPFKQDMPVNPPEDELAVVVQPALFEKTEGTYPGEREISRQRFGVIIEVYKSAFAMTGFNITVGMSVEFSRKRPVFDVTHYIFSKNL
jgi:hypothetical protein